MIKAIVSMVGCAAGLMLVVYLLVIARGGILGTHPAIILAMTMIGLGLIKHWADSRRRVRRQVQEVKAKWY